ncbi:hypothetical protein SLEP1_g25201 [Rubroshorea leprosula]|uniref:Uncharacterized protein n=1 Tax=Rubroshorea leprosula TaxID=152421 RepID=A0AAV5JTN7_9ROSI|nr:hypothetical protein SLEP1_g25201 [Rubroshorea leprosula]
MGLIEERLGKLREERKKKRRADGIPGLKGSKALVEYGLERKKKQLGNIIYIHLYARGRDDARFVWRTVEGCS